MSRTVDALSESPLGHDAPLAPRPNLRGWLRARWSAMAGSTRIVLVAAAAGILFFLGAAAGTGQHNTQVKAAEKAQKAAEGQRDQARSQVAADRAQIASLQSQLTQTGTQVASEQHALDARAAQLAQQAQSLQQQSDALAARTAAANAASFGDGLYQVGRDVQPGLYHTAGGPSCYWAKLRSSNPSDISDNNLSAGPETVTVDSPFLMSRGCGTWTKVG